MNVHRAETIGAWTVGAGVTGVAVGAAGGVLGEKLNVVGNWGSPSRAALTSAARSGATKVGIAAAAVALLGSALFADN